MSAYETNVNTPEFSRDDAITPDPKAESCVKKEKKPMHLLWAFLIPFGIMTSIYAALGTYPFGESSVLVLDLNGQYVYFFEALRDAIWGDGSLIYSFSRSMGGEFLGMYAYYLASPFSYLVCLFPQHMILEALFLMLVLKCGLSGLTFCYYLEKNKITKNRAAQVMFSCMYALSSYGVVMQNNTMWFDCVILLPLVALGTESLIKERKYKMFTFSLALSVISNFYIGYMVCIFVFVYFFFYYFSRSKADINPLGEKHHFVRSISRVGVFSAIAIAISAFILLPALYSLTFGKNDFSNPNYFPAQKFDFLDLFSMIYPGSYDTVRPEGLPLVYAGLLAVIFLPIFFISKHFSKREKIASGIFILFFVLSFNMSTLDMVWHGMQRPNWLNYRYSFMLIFFVLLLGCKAFDRLRRINPKLILAICAALSFLLVIIQKFEYDNVPDFSCVWFSLIFLSIYAVGLILTSKSKFKITSTMILCVFVCLELFIAGLLNLVALDEDVVISSYDSYHGVIDKIRPIVNDVEESDDSFYRMEKNFHRKVNDPMALGLRGFSNSTSTLNQDTIAFLNRMGLAAQSHWTKYAGATPVFDSLFGVKYVIAKESDTSISPLYTRYLSDSEFGYVAYQNPYSLSIAYGVDPMLKDVVVIDPNYFIENDEESVPVPDGYINVSTPLERYNHLLAKMTGSSEPLSVFQPIEYEETSLYCKESFTAGDIQHKKYAVKDNTVPAKVSYLIKPERDGVYYCYFPSDYPREVKLTINQTNLGSYMGSDTHCVVSLGELKAGVEYVVSLTLKGTDLYIIPHRDYFFYFDSELFSQTVSSLMENQYKISSYTEDSFEGTISVSEGKETIFTSIPFDKGWHVYVDGKEVETYEILDSLIAFDVAAGEHTLRMEYRSDAMVYGSIFTIAGVVILALIVIFEKQLKVLYFKIMPKDGLCEEVGNKAEFLIDDCEILDSANSVDNLQTSPEAETENTGVSDTQNDNKE